MDRYGHSSRDGRHERKIVRQLEQVGNRQGESNIAVKRDILLLAAAGLCTPLARRSVLIEEDHGETSNFYGFKVRPGGPPLGLRGSKRQGALTVLMNATLPKSLSPLEASEAVRHQRRATCRETVVLEIWRTAAVSQRSKTDQAAAAVGNTLSRSGGSEPARMCGVRARGSVSAGASGRFYHRRAHLPRQPVARRKISSNTTAPMKALIVNATIPLPK